jgi:nucleoid DNA-binding protein
MKSIDPEEFFKLVATHSGIIDVSIARNVYYGMIKTISRELRGKHTIKLPDWGEFNLKIHKARNFVSVTGKPGMLPAKPTIKFSPDYKVKKFFQELGL